MAINRANVRTLLQDFNFKDLFIEEMGWGSVPNTRPAPMEIDGTRYMRRLIAQMSGVSVFEIYPADPNAKLPDAKTRAAIHKQIEGLSHENLLIFLDDDQNRTQSMWYWMKRDGKKKPQPREHLYLKGQPGDLFLSKLDGMVIELDDLREDGTIPITEVTSRLAESLDVERVTRKFYNEFSTLRVDFIDMIEGIEREADRFWYASVLLNRLMFIYFLQEKGFIQGDSLDPKRPDGDYLREKLRQSQARGADRYFGEFLNALFFEGFAKPADKRTPEARQLLGEIKYLNGGLFIPHKLEIEYQNIYIPDRAFENVLNLFGSYSWHLDDTPGAADNEINPDVLGYIFEKYINQKAFGAYYTRTEITQYLCERTIHAVILDRIHQNSQRQFSDLNEVLVKLDADLCRLLLNAVLPKISILDPACGSGAFLVAAMKTLLDVYSAVLGKIDFLNDRNLTDQLTEIRRTHPSINYYVRKRIITDNLYGVDIMEEAAEIAKLRLFLVLVSSAQKVEHLEPLPNIDFNIMTGNSLMGLLTVDPERFDASNQSQDMLQRLKAQQYKKTLEEKNRQIDIYRKTSSMADDLQALRERIDELRRDAYQDLNEIMLDDFNRLGIRFEEVQLKGKPKRRGLKVTDIKRLNPFHWGYDFDEIIETRGGFDIIITNPPWEVVQTTEKEFFQEYDQLIQKNKLKITDWNKQREELMQDPEIREAWLDYASQYPHQWSYFKLAPQFVNQTTRVEGKASGNKPNLYNLFTEQCYNLLRPGGHCGIVIPSGIYTDFSTMQLRQMLFEQTRITSIFGFENRKEIFEGVHRSFKFVVLTFEKAGYTEKFPAAFMRHDVAELEGFPNGNSVRVSVDLVRQLSPDSLSIPEFKSDQDISIAEKMLPFPLLADTEVGWGLELYGEELNMTRSSGYFKSYETDYPVYEGSMIWQFDSYYSEPRYWIEEHELREDFLKKRMKRIAGLSKVPKDMRNDYEVYRLAIRKIASNTNERTLISSMLPRNALAGHSLSVSFPFSQVPQNYNQLQMTYQDTLVLIALINSFVADYVLRGRMTTNLSLYYLYQLPIPRLAKGDRFYSEILGRSAKLICTAPEFDDLAREVSLGSHQAGVTNETQRARLRAELDGMIAHIYGLTEEEFAYILSNFPLVSEPVKVAARNAYRDVERGLVK